MVSDAILERWAIDGFFVFDDVVDPAMLDRLRQAAPRVKAKARSGEVHLHANYAGPGDPWVIDGLLTSLFGESVFAEYMVAPRLLELAHAFLGPEIRLGYLGLLTNPLTTDFDLYWHRDVLKMKPEDFPDVSQIPPIERARTTAKLRWSTALVDDSNLRVVPGSHLRWGSDEENRTMDNHLTADLPGMQVVSLKAGQTVFYDERIIHKALTRKEKLRLSLFGTWARYTPQEPKRSPIPEMRWMLRPGARDTFPSFLHEYYDRFCEAYRNTAPASALITHADTD